MLCADEDYFIWSQSHKINQTSQLEPKIGRLGLISVGENHVADAMLNVLVLDRKASFTTAKTIYPKIRTIPLDSRTISPTLQRSRGK